ncbi:MAG: colanic acid biosynthesis glycosyltransferase WcaI [Cyanobacteria bacterium J083]|nr:MAG: colanic acid biosynthesis glycosyltransferase WcaI [Cyanobacteria bacterium J083]
MKILIYSYNYYPEPIGIAPLMTELAEGLAKRGHEVRVLTAMPWYPQRRIYPAYRGKIYCTEERNGVKIQRSFVWTRRQAGFRNRALFEISFMVLSFFQGLGWRPDVIFLTVPGLPVALPATLLAKIFRRPIVLNLQDILPDAAVHVGLISNPKLIKIFSRLEKFAYANATKISVISDGFTENITAKGVPIDKIVEIPNWVDVDFIKPIVKPDNYFRLEHNLTDKFVVLYSGNIALTQGLETVIQAATYLTDFPEIAIVIVGENNALQRLDEYCQRVGANNVKLVPFQPREKLPEMLSAADVGLVVQKSNVLDFNMPSKIQVLLASGRAIIASVPATGTAARAITKSQAGLVTPAENPQALAEAIIKLYQQPELVKSLGVKGRKYAEEHYSLVSALDSYEELFNSLQNS